MKSRLITPILIETPLGIDAGPNANPVGLICAANESRFVSANYSEPLTALTIGWKDPEDLEAILEKFFPKCDSPRRFDFKKANNAQAFVTEVDDERAIGSPFKRVEYTGEEADGKTRNKGLTMRIDHDGVADVEAAVTQGTGLLMQRLARNDLRRGFALLDTVDHAGGNKAFSAATNPDGFIRAMGRLSAETVGIFPNTYAIGELAWDYRLDAYEAPARVNGQNRANLTPQDLARYLRADVVDVVRAKYQSTATAKGALLSARIYAYLTAPGASKDEPSAIKRFVSPTRSGGRFAVYRQEYEKFTDLSLEHYSNIIATGIGVESIDATQ